MGSSSVPKEKYLQEPVAVIGLACRLPGDSNSPTALWEFLKRGGVAKNEAPISRFDLKTHHDGSRKPKTMRSPGGMFLENIDPEEFDAGFFNISRVDAIAMDPQQRQLLEVVYEGLENAGISLEALDGKSYGCFVGSYAVDYSDMHLRDPEDRPPSVTVGVGRAILSNRISHFLNIKGPSFTVDTACSGSLVALDVACRYLNTREIAGAIVAASNLYLSPEHNMDGGAMKGAASPSGKCHTFDMKADGYIKAEGVNAVILKRLDDAIRDGDPIRAVIRGSATNSDGRTPGIASPSAEAQAAAIRAAYSNAGITDLTRTSYVECHGTGTQAGDPMEVTGISTVFTETRSPGRPLIIGSIKSNVGHSEPAAGISGLMKVILSIENGLIPGNPTFITPNPKIDFEKSRVRASRTTIPWPDVPFRRAGVNSFGYGGSNAHVIVEEPWNFMSTIQKQHTSSFFTDYDDFFAEESSTRPYTLVFSANDGNSLQEYCKVISKHLLNPGVTIKLPDLSYTLSERRSRHFHRAYVVTDRTYLDQGAFVFGKKNTNTPRVGFVFTGQGAQWSQMGRSLIDTFPAARTLLRRLDNVLQTLPNPPLWSLIDELADPRSSDHLRKPEFSQPLCTALQLAILSILESWGISPNVVVGHSSGEIAAACAAGLLTQEEAIKVAYFRGLAAINCRDDTKAPVGMLAVGLGVEKVQDYIKGLESSMQIGCINSPNSVTLSGKLTELDAVMTSLKADGHFARMLQVDLAYHSQFMADIAAHYEGLINQHCGPPLSEHGKVPMFSSVTGERLDRACNANYWKSNMASTVRFDEAVRGMVSGEQGTDFLIEIGPSGTLAGPIKQITGGLGAQGSNIQYCAAFSRGADSVRSLFDVAGRLFIAGGPVNLSKVNEDPFVVAGTRPSVIVDLPNYVWNHSTKYWHESEASKDWRYRQFPLHDLLGSKILGTSWHAPSWKKILKVSDLHWLKDHKMGHEIVFPAAAFCAMAVEALYQARVGVHLTEGSALAHKPSYKLRNVTFPKALVLQENGDGHKIMLSLAACPGTKDSWHEFKISSLNDKIWTEHSRGLICAEEDFEHVADKSLLAPLSHPTPGHLWYKAMHDAGYSFGPLFQKHLQAESMSGSRKSRSLVSLTEPEKGYQQSFYPMHPVALDGCFQTVGPSLWKGNRSTVDSVLVPAIIDSLVINTRKSKPVVGISVTSSEYVGVGRREETKNYMSSASVYDPDTGALLLSLKGLRYNKLDTRENLHATHSYSRVDWKADITFLTQEKLHELDATEPYRGTSNDEQAASKVSQAIDLIAHKKPNLKVLEFHMTQAELTSLWLDGDGWGFDNAARAACHMYYLASSDAEVLMSFKEKYEVQRNVEFGMLDLVKGDTAITGERDFDLVIIRLASVSDSTFMDIVRNAHGMLREGGYVLIIEDGPFSPRSDSDDFVHVDGSELTISSKPDRSGMLLDSCGFQNTLKVPCNHHSVHISAAAPKEAKPIQYSTHVNLVHLATPTENSNAIIDTLTQRGWTIQQHRHIMEQQPISETGILPKSTVLIIDELDSPILANATERQWQIIKDLFEKDNRILWVTSGSQLDVTNPDRALIHGLARTCRAEDPLLSLTTLDVESSTGPETVISIEQMLKYLGQAPQRTRLETEFIERGGILRVSRIRPDDLVNQAEKDDSYGAGFVKKTMHESDTCIRLRCERLGTLDSLRYAEVAAQELPIPDGLVEVEVYAAGVNFKDVAVTMGIVPENEHLPGLEGAGIVRRVGKSIGSFRPGQRVLVYEKGTFANRIQLTPERVHLLPDNMTFEEAATMPSVYLVTIYGLLHMANMKKGQTVLIHSASGGVGIAAIQLCQYVGVEVYATVGTEEKRKFLTETFGIPPERIFSSRTIEFASKIMSITDGKGVDVILNSLTGELLDESWRIIADGGNMIEIGKKDVLARNNLSMEPFNRNASFRAVDMSHSQISDPLIAGLLSEIMDLTAKGHIKPIAPMRVFSFEDIVSALRYLRAGTHLGKVVVSNGPPPGPIELLVRPAPKEVTLRQDGSYLIVGGLKGLCGSLAIYLARLGAKHLIVLSRSGYADEKSQGVLEQIYAEGCQVQLVTGNVCKFDDVQNVFNTAKVPIRGVIQGAMVLRDKIFGSMTIDDFHTTISSKVLGTWNLHNASLGQPLPLDFFTLLSSISGVVGKKGQANYSAANVFLDNFALYRHRLGLCANSVDLGVIEDVGYVAEHMDLQATFDSSVWTPINEGLLHKILKFSILQQGPKPINERSASQLITGITIPQAENSPLLAHDTRFSSLSFGDGAGHSPSSSASAASETSKAIQAFTLSLSSPSIPPETILSSCVAIVSAQFTLSLRLSEPMEPAKPLAAYGLDSLAAVEFRNWARLELGCELTTLEITGARSLFSLCERIIGKVRPVAAAVTTKEAAVNGGS